MRSLFSSSPVVQTSPEAPPATPETHVLELPAPGRVNTSAEDGFVFVFDPKGAAANRYRAIVAQMLERVWPRKLMMLTSPAAGDGKTLTSINLALALEEKKFSVLLVELTLARPRCRFVFGAPPSARGVESVLRGEAQPQDVTFRLGDTRLAIMSVAAPLQDYRLLEGNRYLPKIFEFGKTHYDWIILDSPSVGETRAVNQLATQAEPVIMVTRSHRTKLEKFRKASKVLGRNLDYVIFNDTRF